jgi:hypothetical protein
MPQSEAPNPPNPHLIPLPLEPEPQIEHKLPEEFAVPDIMDLVRRGTHHTAILDGVVHIVDSRTGTSLALTTANPGANERYIPTRTPDGATIWKLESVQHVESTLKPAYYSPIIVDDICRQVAEGGSVSKICNGRNGMPSYNEFCRWRRAHPWIVEALDRAREDRAERLRDEALDLADEAVSVKDAAAQALKVETRKWAASVDSPRYNPKTKVEATLNVPTQIVVMTGIERDVSPQNNLPPAPSTPTLDSGGE